MKLKQFQNKSTLAGQFLPDGSPSDNLYYIFSIFKISKWVGAISIAHHFFSLEKTEKIIPLKNIKINFNFFVSFKNSREYFEKMFEDSDAIENQLVGNINPMPNIIPLSPMVDQCFVQKEDYSSDEPGCYSSSDGDFVPNTLGLSILIYSYFLSVAIFIYRTIRNIIYQGTV
jgi:hypothetical protein